MYTNSNKFKHLLMYRLASLPLYSQPFDFSDVQLETKKHLPLSEVRLPTTGQIEEPAVPIAGHYLIRSQMVRIDIFVALVTKHLVILVILKLGKWRWDDVRLKLLPGNSKSEPRRSGDA